MLPVEKSWAPVLIWRWFGRSVFLTGAIPEVREAFIILLAVVFCGCVRWNIPILDLHCGAYHTHA